MSNRPVISLVAPVYNEAEVLPEFVERACAALSATGLSWEMIFADDGSLDATAELIRAHRQKDSRVGLVSLSRNFGKEIAMTAGLDHARGEAVVVIDADLQDPPELIGEMIALWRDGYDVVYARRSEREGESALKRLTAHMFYRVLNKLGDQLTPPDVGDFRLDELARGRRASSVARTPSLHERDVRLDWLSPDRACLQASPSHCWANQVELLAPLELFDRRHHKLLYSPPSVCFLFWSFDRELGCAIWVIHRRSDDYLQ